MTTPADFYDAELRAHHEHLRAAYGLEPGDEVLDIGCGAGLTTREAGRAAAPGNVVGVDVSEPMLERARVLTAAEGLVNVRYELGDAQVHRFEPAGFDAAISRFGTMFFSDPAVAFANIAAALRPGARLVLLVWQRREDNAWVQAIEAALGDARQPPALDPFSLGDAEATAQLLEGAGFEAPHFEDVREPVFYGRDPDAALAVVSGFQYVSDALARLSADEAARAVERLRQTLAAHYSSERGVALDARSWLITARRCGADSLLADQVAYYRARAPEYLEDTLDLPGGHELETALDTFTPTGDVLELACGPGVWTPQLLRHAESVTAIDAAPEMLAIARDRVRDERVRFVLADLFEWRPDRRYDVVFFGFWLSHVPLERFASFWALVDACLAPDGRVFFVDDAYRTSDELVEGAASSTIRRRLRDGSTHRAVKVPHTPRELEARLTRLGWDIKVSTSAGPFFWGGGTRA